MEGMSSVFLIPLVGIVGGCAMIVAVVGIVFWYKARERELLVHQEMRLKEMEHQRQMKELELEIERTRTRPTSATAA
jgi:hypothetical protein